MGDIGGAISGYFGYKAQDKASSRAQDTQMALGTAAIESQEKMFDKSLALQQPYHNYGKNALREGSPESLDPRTLTQSNMVGDFNAGADTGLKDFQFELDPNDPIYKWKQEQMEESVNRAMASRGGYNSRAAINVLADKGMQLAADEMNSQYGRAVGEHGMANALASERYGRNIGEYDIGRQATMTNNALTRSDELDQFNIDAALNSDKYGRFVDAMKIGQGSAAAAGQNALATGQGIAGTQSNMANALANIQMSQGSNLANLYAGLGAAPANSLAQGMNAYQMFNNVAAQNGAYSSTPYSYNALSTGYSGGYTPGASSPAYYGAGAGGAPI